MMQFQLLADSIHRRLNIHVTFDHRLDGGHDLNVHGIVNIIEAEDGSGNSWIITVLTNQGPAKGYLRTMP